MRLAEMRAHLYMVASTVEFDMAAALPVPNCKMS
jgi:hypothetical protein